MSKSMALHCVSAAYTNVHSKNELAHLLLTEGTHSKQGSMHIRVKTVLSTKYSGVVLLTNLCVNNKIKILS